MKRTYTSLFSLGIFLFAALSIRAQDEPMAKKYENPKWKNIVLVDYKPGKMGRATEIINEYFVKAADKAGTSKPEMVINMSTGEWDRMMIWNMKGGIEEMNWEMSPDGAKWTKAFREIAGGKEKADALQAEYASCVARSSSNIGKLP